ncbi:MAG: DUF2884 family protein [Arenimonas sp.]
MKSVSLTIALMLASGGVHAHSSRDNHVGCDIRSAYVIDTYRRAFLFNQPGRRPAEIGIGGGRLFIDGKEQTLSAADHQRLRQLELEMQQMVPEVKQVTLEAVEIAFTALTEVARGLSSDPQATVSSLESARQRVRTEMVARPLAVFDHDAMADVVKPILTEYVPKIVGGAISSGLKAAFAGEKESREFKARMDHMGDELNKRVDARAKALEPLAENMCQRLRRMDGIDDSLEFRLPDGEALQLLRIDQHKRD